ncbi:MAG: DUF411 domain-containing protein [Gemmatimonadaceae bacterium]
MLSRRHFFLSGAAALVAGRTLFAEAPPTPPSVLTVYKDPGCDCCAKWVKYMSANGFVVNVQNVKDVDAIKRTMNVPAAMQSCHTAVVGAYIVEGHVPAELVKKVLVEKPGILGLAVPGMVDGSPGMEGARTEHYDVMAFGRDGKARLYAKR